MKHSFSNIPQVKRARTRINLDHSIKTSMTVGKLYPLECIEVLPGDTWRSKVASVSRVSSAFLKPIMDNLFMDIHHFFVPLRLVYEDADKVFGNPNPSQYLASSLDEMPKFSDISETSSITIAKGTVGDYLGLPVGTLDADISVAPFRAFAKIYNEWFRNENVIDETFVQLGEAKASEKPNSNAWSANNYTGQLPSVSKIKDIFTSCLPAPQKGIAPQIPVSSSSQGAPVYTESFDVPAYADGAASPNPLHFDVAGLALNEQATEDPMSVIGLPSSTLNTMWDAKGMSADPTTTVRPSITPSNLWARFEGFTGISVNDMRFAFAFQKMLERDALGGSRYNEYLLAHYGVVNPDARLQFTEYIGGGRIPITVQQVAQTAPAADSDESVLAELGAFSLSGGFSKFSKSVTEHGYIITVACIKQPHTYSQGIAKMWRRFERNDFFDPLFAHLGEQPIYQTEIYGAGDKDTVFGYNEYGAQYRYLPNLATGEMRASDNANLGAIWTLGDKFDNAPTLSQSFIEENSENVDRTLAVPSENEQGVHQMDNFIVDIFEKCSAIRVMPLYSTPGLIDH